MPNWITNLFFAFFVLQAAWALSLSIRLQWELKSSLVIDWGPQPRRVHNWAFVATVALMAWYFLKHARAEPIVVVLVIMNVMLAIRVVLAAFRHLGIYKDGMLVLTQILWTTSGTFIRWSEIKVYRWEEQGRLLINPGWTPIICQIWPEMLVDLKAALKEKCPNAELEIQHVTQ